MDEDRLLGGNDEQVWSYFDSLVENDNPIYAKARFGIGLLFDVKQVIEGFNINYLKERKNVIIINNKEINISDYYTEMSLRRKLMINYLLENFGKKSIAKPRGGNTK